MIFLLFKTKFSTLVPLYRHRDIGNVDLSSNVLYDLKSDNLQYNTLGRWDKRLIDQASDVPSTHYFFS